MSTEPTNPITEHAAQMAAVPDQAADIASKLVEQIVSGHLESALEAVECGDGAFEDYSPHPISIEGDARAIVAAVTPILTGRLRAILVRTAVELYRQWQHAIDKVGSGPTWTKEHALYCKGKAIGAVVLLQSMLADTGEIGPEEAEDEDLGAAWALVDAERQANKAVSR